MSYHNGPGRKLCSPPKRRPWSQRARQGGLLLLGSLLGCGSSTTNQILVQVTGEPDRTAVLSVQATLGGKMAMAPIDITTPLDRFGVSLPADASGQLTLNVLALDSDRCTQGTAMPMVNLPAQEIDPPLMATITAVSPRKCGPLTACPVGATCAYSPAQNNTISGLWGSAPNNIWAVGLNGSIAHYDGATWTSVISGAPGDLNAIWGSAANDIWAVGVIGATLHYDGKNWTSIANSIINPLNGVYGISSTDVWAVGDSPTTTSPGEFWHWDGKGWKAVPNMVNGQLLGVWASSPTDVFAVGASGLILHYNGSSVNFMSSNTTNALTSLWGSGPTQVVAAGVLSTLLKYDGSSWTSLPNGGSTKQLNAIFGTSAAVYAVGTNGTILRSTPALDSFALYSTKPASASLYAGQLGTNGIAWVGGLGGYLGFFDTRP